MIHSVYVSITVFERMLRSFSFIKHLFAPAARKHEHKQREEHKQKEQVFKQYLAELKEIDNLSKVLMNAIHSNKILQIIQHKEVALCYHQASLKLLIKYPVIDIDLIAQTGHQIHVLNKEIEQLKDDYEDDIRELEELLAQFDERVKELQTQIDMSDI